MAKNSYVTLAAVLVMALCCNSCGETARATTQPPETSVRAALDQFFEVSKEQDWDEAGKLMSDDFLMLGDGAQVYDKAQYVKLLKEDNLLLLKHELQNFKIGVSKSQDLAWMTYKGYFESQTHGKFGRVNTVETLLFRNENGKWLMFRAHASIQELDTPSTEKR